MSDKELKPVVSDMICTLHFTKCLLIHKEKTVILENFTAFLQNFFFYRLHTSAAQKWKIFYRFFTVYLYSVKYSQKLSNYRKKKMLLYGIKCKYFYGFFYSDHRRSFSIFRKMRLMSRKGCDNIAIICYACTVNIQRLCTVSIVHTQTIENLVAK